jgi:hypothetical protein
MGGQPQDASAGDRSNVAIRLAPPGVWRLLGPNTATSKRKALSWRCLCCSARSASKSFGDIAGVAAKAWGEAGMRIAAMDGGCSGTRSLRCGRTRIPSSMPWREVSMFCTRFPWSLRGLLTLRNPEWRIRGRFWRDAGTTTSQRDGRRLGGVIGFLASRLKR